MLIGNNVVLVVYGILMAQVLKDPIDKILPPIIRSDFSILLSQTLIATIIVLIVAEFLPKVLFRINPNQILSFCRTCYYTLLFTYPVIQVYIGFRNLL